MLIVICLVLTYPSVATDRVKELDSQIEMIDRRAPKHKPSQEAFNEISRETGVPKRELEKQHEKTRMNAGSLFIANTLAKETGKSFDEIVALHQGGHGWGSIAKDNDVKLGPLVSDARKLEKRQRERSRGKKQQRDLEKKPDADKKEKSGGKNRSKEQKRGKSKSEKKNGKKK